MTDIVRIPFNGGEKELKRLPGKATYGGYVYVVGFSTGVVKVGSTSNPATRVAAHLGNAIPFSAGYIDVWVSPLHDGHRDTEKKLIGLAEGLSAGRTRQEWFTGIEVAELVALAEELPLPEVDVEAHKRHGEAVKEAMSRLWKSAPGQRKGLPDYIAEFFGRDGDGYRATPDATGFTGREQVWETAESLASSAGLSVHDVMAMDWIDLVEHLAVSYVRTEALHMRAWAIGSDRDDVLKSLYDVADELPLTGTQGQIEAA